jgi:hypothetical protein
MAKKQTKSRPLVYGYLENISGDVFENYKEGIREYIRGKKGVYALYKEEKLVYVGKAVNLRGRLKHHLIDRHAGSWDNFSVYLTKSDRHLSDLEALVIRIADPKENLQRSKFVKSINMENSFKKDIKKKQEEEMEKIFRRKFGKVTKKKSKGRKGKPKLTPEKKRRKKGEPVLKEYVRKRFRIRAYYKGRIYRANVRPGGSINYKGKLYTSPSYAGMAITKTSTLNGWKFWKYRNKKGEWVYLDELRKGKSKRWTNK